MSYSKVTSDDRYIHKEIMGSYATYGRVSNGTREVVYQPPKEGETPLQKTSIPMTNMYQYFTHVPIKGSNRSYFTLDRAYGRP
jgi:hypothetical protein